MKQMTIRIIFAFIGGALIWEGIRGGIVGGNLYEFFLIIIGVFILYKSRFW